MNCSSSNPGGTAPTSLLLASGGALAQWLLRNTSAAGSRQPAGAATDVAGVADVADVVGDSEQKNHAQQEESFLDPCRVIASASKGWEGELKNVAKRKGKTRTETTETYNSEYCVMEETLHGSWPSDESRRVPLSDVGEANELQNRNHCQSSCACITLQHNCTCKRIKKHQVKPLAKNSKTNLTGNSRSKTAGRNVSSSKEFGKGTDCLVINKVLDLPCNLFSLEEKYLNRLPSTDSMTSEETSSKFSNSLPADEDHKNEFHSRCKRCRLSAPDEDIHHHDGLLLHLKEDVAARAQAYFQVIREHMPLTWFHSTIQNSLKRLSFRSKFLDDKGSLSAWVIDLLTMLHLCQLTNFENVSLDLPSFTLEVLLEILSLIHDFNLSQLISSISLPFDENETTNSHRFRNYSSQSERNIAFSKSLSRLPSVVQSYRNLQNLLIRSKNEKLLRSLQHLQLSSLVLTSSHLTNATILGSFLGLRCPREDGHLSPPTVMAAFEMHGKPLSMSLQSLHVPNCRLSMATYRSLIQVFPNLTDLQVKTKLDLLTQRQLNPIASTNLNESSKAFQKSKTHFTTLSVKCEELALFDIKSQFPFLKHLSVQLNNIDAFQSLSAVNELSYLESLQLRSIPTFSQFYRNIELDNLYPFLKKKLPTLTTLTLQNFDISLDSFTMLSTLPKLSSMTLKSCWIKASDDQHKQGPMFTNLSELQLTSIPSRSVTSCLLSGGSVEHLSLVPLNNEMHASVTCSTKKSLMELLITGHLASLVSLTISSYFLSHALVKQLCLLPRLRKVTTIEQPGASARDLLKCVSMTPSHITFCSES